MAFVFFSHLCLSNPRYRLCFFAIWGFLLSLRGKDMTLRELLSIFQSQTTIVSIRWSTCSIVLTRTKGNAGKGNDNAACLTVWCSSEAMTPHSYYGFSTVCCGFTMSSRMRWRTERWNSIMLYYNMGSYDKRARMDNQHCLLQKPSCSSLGTLKYFNYSCNQLFLLAQWCPTWSVGLKKTVGTQGTGTYPHHTIWRVWSLHEVSM